MTTSTVAIALGANLGDREETLDQAVAAIGALPDITVSTVSRWYDTAPVGDESQPRFLNGAMVVSTSLEPRPLLEELHAIERRFGRDRAKEERWGARTLDLDILLFGERVVEEAGLTIPHPRMHERGFVLEPLAEIGAALRHPIRGESVGELWGRLVQSERDAISGAGSGLE